MFNGHYPVAVALCEWLFWFGHFNIYCYDYDSRVLYSYDPVFTYWIKYNSMAPLKEPIPQSRGPTHKKATIQMEKKGRIDILSLFAFWMHEKKKETSNWINDWWTANKTTDLWINRANAIETKLKSNKWSDAWENSNDDFCLNCILCFLLLVNKIIATTI